MKTITYQFPKSSFLNVEKDTAIIVKQIMSNNRLQKLLFYDSKDALRREPLTPEQVTSLFGTRIKIVPKVPIEQTERVYMIISFGDFTPSETNPEFRNNTIQFDIVCNYEQWLLDDMQLRPYKIAGELDSMFSGAKLTGIGKLHFLGAVQTTVEGEDFAGVSLLYAAVHGEDDKLQAPNVSGNKDLEENFNAMFNPNTERELGLNHLIDKED